MLFRTIINTNAGAFVHWKKNITMGARKMTSALDALHTQRQYYYNTQQDRLTTSVLAAGRDEKGFYLIPRSTIFHPQGGGQPADKGKVFFGKTSFDVVGLSEDGHAIKHYLNVNLVENLPEAGSEIAMQIDMLARDLFARLHSAGHLLSDVVSTIYPHLQGYKGNHFPGGQAFVLFRLREGFEGSLPDKEEAKECIQSAMDDAIARGVAMETINPHDGEVRKMAIEGHSPVPCGGTHLSNTSDIVSFEIRSIRNKKGEMKVGYHVHGDE